MKRLLWLCTHRTQWREELPLLLEAGFEVVPAKWGHRDYPVHENPEDPYYIQSWRSQCTLPVALVEELRAVNWFHDAPRDMGALANQVFDAVIITTFPDTLLSFARWFSKPIFYRVFGLAGEGAYSDLFRSPDFQQLWATPAYRNNLYHWCPILPTLRQAEDVALIRNEIVLEPCVSPERLPAHWQMEKAEPCVALVLSRVAEAGYYGDRYLAEVAYYGKLYTRIASRFRVGPEPIRLRILGQNQPGAFGDAEILGPLPEWDFCSSLARATAFFYQGESICHLHWSVLEALAMGVPVVMMQSGYLAWLLIQVAGLQARGQTHGVVEGLDEARTLLARCLKKPELARAIAHRQRPLAEYVTNRNRAIRLYRERLHHVLDQASKNNQRERAAWKQCA
jgi:glycosyltransferase involved in cell wall biosynthesis